MSSIKEMIEHEVIDIGFSDHVMIVQDGCYQLITYENFIKNISMGGFAICEAVLNCWDDMGDFNTGTPVDNQPPNFNDIYLALGNREDKEFDSLLFLSHYSDTEGDEMAYIIIKGGDLSGYTYDGNPLYQGLMIPTSNLNQLHYDSRSTDIAYRQSLEIEVYDENNVKAI